MSLKDSGGDLCEIRCGKLEFSPPHKKAALHSLPLDAHPEAAFPVVTMRNWTSHFPASYLRIGPNSLACWMAEDYLPGGEPNMVVAVFDWRRGRLAKVCHGAAIS